MDALPGIVVYIGAGSILALAGALAWWGTRRRR
jgi:uncharacterized protein (TIGR03382 family)